MEDNKVGRAEFMFSHILTEFWSEFSNLPYWDKFDVNREAYKEFLRSEFYLIKKPLEERMVNFVVGYVWSKENNKND